MDGMCEAGEDMTCFDCLGGGTCDLDGTCDAGEDPAICPDCMGGGGMCDLDGMCEAGEDPTCGDCLPPPPPICGDGTCTPPEDTMSCPSDCP
jgi:hypothetical protein